MSPWLSEELRVILCPDQVMLLPVRRSLTLRGLHRTIREPQSFCVEGAAGSQSWRPALLALEAALPGVATGRTAATVVLSNRLVRYALVPWQAGLSDSQEDLSYARHCFSRVYGKDAAQWEVRISHQAPGKPRLAGSVDAELLASLRSVLARPGIALRSIQPHLMAAFNDARRRLGRCSAWLALLEPGHLCLALLRDGHWTRVRSARIASAWREELTDMLEREAFLADDLEVPREVFVGQLEPGEPVLPELGGWQFHALDHAPPVRPASADRAQFAMAATG